MFQRCTNEFEDVNVIQMWPFERPAAPRTDLLPIPIFQIIAAGLKETYPMGIVRFAREGEDKDSGKRLLLKNWLPMMWETVFASEPGTRLYDFKYLGRGNVWGLNKPAVFTEEGLTEIFQLYSCKDRTEVMCVRSGKVEYKTEHGAPLGNMVLVGGDFARVFAETRDMGG